MILPTFSPVNVASWFWSGKKVLGLDAFGWGVVLFLLVLFGIPYTRAYFRRAGIPKWPIVSARIIKTTIAPGPPREILAAPASAPITELIPYHCRANYVFLADGKPCEGTFALLAKDAEQAQGMADSLRARSILVRCNPRRPQDSVLEEREFLGTKVFQEGWHPINPKVW
jgi:hypothetical protein